MPATHLPFPSTDTNPSAADVADEREALAVQSRMILSAMEAAARGRLAPTAYERRGNDQTRRAFRGEGDLNLFADAEGTKPWKLFLRDADPRAIGFVTPDRLPLGYGGRLQLVLPDGGRVDAEVTIVRCRTCYGGWFEGAAYFHTPQNVFATQATVTL